MCVKFIFLFSIKQRMISNLLLLAFKRVLLNLFLNEFLVISKILLENLLLKWIEFLVNLFLLKQKRLSLNLFLLKLKYVVRVVVGVMFWASSLGAVAYQDSNLPQNITLNGGQRSDTITSTPGNFQSSTIGYGRNPNFNVSGVANSQYQLQVQDTTTTFYAGNFSFTQGVQVWITNAHTLTFDNNKVVRIAQNSQFNTIMSNTKINAQGSEYGGDSKMRFNLNSKLILESNAKADFQNMYFFIHDGDITLDNSASLTIEASNAIRIQQSLNNNGGKIIFNGDTFNIGGQRGIIPNDYTTTSNFTSTNGDVVINGDFYNGGKARVEECPPNIFLCVFDPAFSGGGNLNINGGSFVINGRLISQNEGDNITRQSSVSVNGTELVVTNGFINNGVLNLGVYNGTLGSIKGNIDSTNGIINVNISGVNDGIYTFFKGGVTGVEEGKNLFINGISEFTSFSFDSNTWQVKINVKQEAIESFVSTLDSNRNSILEALKVKYGNIFTMQDSNSLRNITQNVMRGIYSNYIATPISVLDSIKANMQSEIGRIDNSNSVFISPLGLGLIGSSTGIGGLGGLNIGGAFSIKNRVLSNVVVAQGSYAYGSSDLKALDSMSNISYNSNHNIALSVLDRISFGFLSDLELKINAYYLASFMNANREMSGIDNTSDVYNARSRASFSVFGLDSNIGYKFRVLNMIFEPYFGISNLSLALSDFSESGADKAVLVRGSKQGIYNLNVLAGLNSGVNFSSSISLLFGLHYEYQAFSSNEIVLSIEDSILRFKMPFAHRFGVNLSGNFTLPFNMSASVNAFYKAAFGGDGYNPNLNFSSSTNYFGFSGTFSYRF